MRTRAKESNWTRRDFGRAMVGAGGTIALGWAPWGARGAADRGESLLTQFTRALDAGQQQALVFPYSDPKRTMVQNHWAVVPEPIAALTAHQQDLALQLVQQVCTPDGFARLTRGREDDSGGWKHDHIAIFGSPDEPDQFEWVLTGRHLSLRGSATGAIQGGPIFLGHSIPGEGSIWREPAQLADRLHRSLMGGSIGKAGSEFRFPVAGLHPKQQATVQQLLVSLTNAFRAFEVPAVAACVTSSNGLNALTWQAYPAETQSFTNSLLAWRLIGPGFRWSFHTEPHIHCWFDSI